MTTTRIVHRVVEHETFDVDVVASLVSGGQYESLRRAIQRGKLAVVVDRGRLRLKAGPVVGSIPLVPGVTIDVAPRVPIRNLAPILIRAGLAPDGLLEHFRSYSSSSVDLPSLVEILADAFVAEFDVIRARGTYRKYVARDLDTSFPRGRILVGRSIQRHMSRGYQHRVSASWHDRTTNHAVHQCLKFACETLYWRLRSDPNGARQRKRLAGLSRCADDLRAVSADTSRSWLRDREVRDPSLLPASRSYYSRVIPVARFVAISTGAELLGSDGAEFLPSLLVNMETTFEVYVRNILRSKLQRPECAVLDGRIQPPSGGRRRLFDEAESRYSASPDIVIRRRNGEIPLIADTKYKAPHAAADRSDVNQVITYAVAYRTNAAVIISPALGAAQAGLRQFGSIGPQRFYEYKIDLAADDLDAEEDRVATAIRSLVA